MRMRDSVKNATPVAFLSILVVLVFLKVTFLVEDRWGHDAFVRWVGLAGFTLALFALFVAIATSYAASGDFGS